MGYLDGIGSLISNNPFVQNGDEWWKNFSGQKNTPGEASASSQAGYAQAAEELKQKYASGSIPLQSYLDQMQKMNLGGQISDMQSNMADPQKYQAYLLNQYKEDPNLSANIQQAKNANNVSASAAGLTGSSANLGQNAKTETGMRTQDVEGFLKHANDLYQSKYDSLMGIYGNQEGLNSNLLKGEIAQQGDIYGLQNKGAMENLSYQNQQNQNMYNTLGESFPFLYQGAKAIQRNSGDSPQNYYANYGQANPNYSLYG